MSEAALIDTEGEGLETSRTVRLRVPARPEYIALARLALSGLAELVALSEERRRSQARADRGRVELGPPRLPGRRRLRLDRVRAHRRRASVEVVDDGAGFDPARPLPLEGEELSEGGLGIAIIRTIADEFEICSRPGDRGSRLRFVKRLQPAA